MIVTTVLNGHLLTEVGWALACFVIKKHLLLILMLRRALFFARKLKLNLVKLELWHYLVFMQALLYFSIGFR